MEIDFKRDCDCWLEVGRCKCAYLKEMNVARKMIAARKILNEKEKRK